MTTSTAVWRSVLLIFVALGLLECCFGLGLFDEDIPPIRDHVLDFATVWFACIFGIGKLLYIAYDQHDDARHLNRVAASLYLIGGYGIGFYCWDEVLGLIHGEDMNNKQVFFAWYAIAAACVVTLGVLWSVAKEIRSKIRAIDEPPTDG